MTTANMSVDIRNNPLTGASGEQAEQYNSLLQDYVEYRASTFKDLKHLCQQAPRFVMAQIFKANLLLSMGTLSTVADAKQCLLDVTNNTPDLSETDKLHCDATHAWSEGNTELAVDIWEKIISRSPHDLLAMKLHHFALFWLGKPERMLAVCQQVSSHWNQETPGYASFLGMVAFAEEELGNYKKSEELSRLAIEQNPEDLWAIHALAHTFEMQGRVEEGIALLSAPSNRYDDRNPFRGHMWWHLGMFLVEKGAFDHALQVYDESIYSDQSSFYLDLQNTASILARLEMCGVDVGDRWHALGEVVKTRQGDHVLAFTEPHHTLVLAKCGETKEIAKQLTSLEKLASKTDRSIAKLVKPLLLPLCEAIRDFSQPSDKYISEQLANLYSKLSDIGGSHAQRDLFSLVEIQSAINHHDYVAAKELLTPRLESRPNSAINWQQYLKVCTVLEEMTEVEKAQAALNRIAYAA